MDHGSDAVRPRRRQAAPRLADVAARAGVHVSVVSKVLNNDPSLSTRPETRARVLRIARELGYRPNAAARGLKMSTMGAVGVVVPSLRNPLWSEITRGVLDVATGLDMAVLIAEVSDEGDPATYVRLVDEGRVDGLLLASSEPPSRVASEIDDRIATVHVNRAVPFAGGNVTMDEHGAVRLVCEHLAAAGYRRLVHVDGPATIDTTRRRVRALEELWRGAGRELTVLHTPFTEQGGHRAAGQAVDLLRRATGVPARTAIAVSQLNQLFGALAALREHGVAIPADVGVVCYDEDPLLDYLDVKVTSVSMPLFELGRQGMTSLAGILAGEEPTDVEVREPMTLVVRRSVGGAGPA